MFSLVNLKISITIHTYTLYICIYIYTNKGFSSFLWKDKLNIVEEKRLTTLYR